MKAYFIRWEGAITGPQMAKAEAEVALAKQQAEHEGRFSHQYEIAGPYYQIQSMRDGGVLKLWVTDDAGDSFNWSFGGHAKLADAEKTFHELLITKGVFA